MSTLTDDTLPATPRAMRDEIVVFAVMAVLLALVPVSGIYPFFVMQALCFALLACAFNLLIGYGGLLSFGHAMFLGTAGYFTAHALKVWGLSPELGILVGTARRRRAWRHHRSRRDPPPGHLFRDDHAGAVAAVVFHLSADAVHPRRGRHPGRSAGIVCSESSISPSPRCSITSCWQGSSAASC